MTESERTHIVSSSFIVALWAKAFWLLSHIGLFPWVMKLWMAVSTHLVRDEKRRRHLNFFLVDAWTLGHLVLALVALFAVQSDTYWILMAGHFLAAYGILRTFELVIYQINVLLFDEYRTKARGGTYQVRGYRRMVILLVHNYFEVIAWFACAHNLLDQLGWVEYATNGVLGSLRESLKLMVSFSVDGVKAVTDLGHTMLLFQAATAVLMTLIMLARFISILPTPETMDEFERKS